MAAKKYINTWKWQIAVWWNDYVYRIAWANSTKPEPGSCWKNIWRKLWITKMKA